MVWGVGVQSINASKEASVLQLQVGDRCRCFVLSSLCILPLRQKARPSPEEALWVTVSETMLTALFSVFVTELSHMRSSPSEYLGNALTTYFWYDCPLF